MLHGPSDAFEGPFTYLVRQLAGLDAHPTSPQAYVDNVGHICKVVPPGKRVAVEV